MLDDIVELCDECVHALRVRCGMRRGAVYDVMRAVQVTVGGVRGDIDGGVQLRCACGIVCVAECAAQRSGVCDSERAAASG